MPTPPKLSGKMSPRKSVSQATPTLMSNSKCCPDDPVGTLFPGISAKDREIVQQLHARSNDVQQWFAEAPGRVTALQANPYETLSELSHALSITLPSALSADLSNLTILFNPLDCVCIPPPSSLIVAVWRFIGQSAENLNAWIADPFQVIQTVATASNASAQDLDALNFAFQWIFGVRATVFGPSTVLQSISGVQSSQLIVKQR